MPRLARLAIAAAAASALTAAGASAAPLSPGGLTLSAGGGCAIQCVQSATVVPTATSASIEVATSVPATVAVSAVPAGSDPQIAAPASGHTTMPLPATLRTVELHGLTPATEYDVTVRATDVRGRTSTRSGRFRTAEPAPGVDVPAPDLAPGAGCALDCIASGTATAHPAIPGRVDLDVRTTSPARITLTLTRTAGGTTKVVKVLQSPAGATSFSPAVEGLRLGTRYGVRVEAADQNGTRAESGAFTTRKVSAVVTYHKLQIIEDGDRVGRGDFMFFYGFGESAFEWGVAKAASGDVLLAPVEDGRPSPSRLVPVAADGALRLWVRANEHDGIAGDKIQTAKAELGTSVAELLAPKALPPWHGTGVTMPTGHDAYAVFATGAGSVRFRVFASVDLHVAN